MSDNGTMSTFAGTGAGGYSGDGGPAEAARLYYPFKVATDGSGAVYIADSSNNRIRRVSDNGTISTFAGTGAAGYSGDGGPAEAAQLNYPYDVATDGMNNLYIADRTNNRIRRVSDNGTISTFAGNGQGYSFAGDGGPATAARLYFPGGVDAGSSGNVYVSDTENNRIRMVDIGGTIDTVAGNGPAGYGGDGGPAAEAPLGYPTSTALDSLGNLYIADFGNSRIRKIDMSGTITTFAGNGQYGYSGDGGPADAAELNNPACVTIDDLGSMYIADMTNHVIRKVVDNGTITTFAGTGTGGYSGDGGLATAAQLRRPRGVWWLPARVSSILPIPTITLSAGWPITAPLPLLPGLAPPAIQATMARPQRQS